MLAGALAASAVGATAAYPSAPAKGGAPIYWQGLIRVGGIKQWVAIRGRDSAKAAMLFLHGGPCEAHSPFLPVFAPWEERYVVAQWDQRGAGRSFGEVGIATPNMTLEQIVQDTIEVTRHVLRRLGARKLILVGHSWGTAVGLSAVRSRPELFHAFVGTGQLVSGAALLARMRSSAVSRAQAAGEAQAAAQINGFSSADLVDMNKFRLMARWAEPFSGSDNAYLAMRSTLLKPAADQEGVAVADLVSREFACLSKLLPASLDFEAGAVGYDVPVPFFVIQGRDDTRTRPELAQAFVNQVRAPAKGYTEIEGGHFACFSNPTAFLNALDSDIGRLGIR